MDNKLQIKHVKIMNIDITKFIYSPTHYVFQFKTVWEGQNIVYHPRKQNTMQGVFEELQWFKAQIAKDFYRAKFELDTYSTQAAKVTGTKTWLTLQSEKVSLGQ